MKGMKSTMAAEPDDQWKVEQDLRTLCESKEIMADPARMAKCKKMAQKKMAEMKSIAA
jgi:hypothetical protein